MKKRILILSAALVLITATAGFTQELMVGVDIPIGMTIVDPDTGNTETGFVIGGRAIVESAITPGFGAALKLGYLRSMYDTGTEVASNYLDILLLGKYYALEQLWVGLGISYDYLLGGTVDGDNFDRGNFEDLQSDIDPFSLVLATGYELPVTENLVAPIGAEFRWVMTGRGDLVNQQYFINGFVGLAYRLNM